MRWYELGRLSWAGRAVAKGLLLRPGCPGSRLGHMEFPLSRSSEAKSRLGMGRELPWLSGLSGRATWEVIGASGRKANSLNGAPEEGWAVSGFGTVKSPGLVLCIFRIT